MPPLRLYVTIGAGSIQATRVKYALYERGRKREKKKTENLSKYEA
jgi:hypothetical protein